MSGFEVFLGLRGAERPVDVRLAPTAAAAKTTKCGAIRVSCPFVGQLIILKAYQYKKPFLSQLAARTGTFF